MFDEVFAGEMRNSYANVRTTPVIQPPSAKKQMMQEESGSGQVGTTFDESQGEDEEPDNEELREAILNYVTQIKDANQDQICMDTEPIKNTGAKTVGAQLKNCVHVTGLMLSGC